MQKEQTFTDFLLFNTFYIISGNQHYVICTVFILA